MKLFDRFNKTYCVNLERRPDRLEDFKNQINKFNLGEFETFKAVDGKELNMDDFKTKLNPGELGLILTNIEIIKKCKRDNIETVLIIEDDCLFTDEIINIDSYFNSLPSDWDMVYFGGNHNEHMGWTQPIIINNKVKKLVNTYSTHFVIIKNSVFDHLLEMLPKLKEPLDVTYTTLQKIFNVYCFYPGIAYQKIDYSDIQNIVTDYTSIIK
jgi:GR25 family glycosyltransferase involved in LPS biosynthesis